MPSPSAVLDLIWDEQQRAVKVKKALEHRAWLKAFSLAVILIALTLTAAILLANLRTQGKLLL